MKLEHAGYLWADIAHRPLKRARSSYARARRKGRIPPSFPRGAWISPAPLCAGVDVLLWARFSRSSPQLPSPHLVLYHLIRGLPPSPATVWPMDKGVQRHAQGSWQQTGGLWRGHDQQTWVQWPKGHFIDTVRMWQKEWFYITEPRGAG